MTGEELPQPFLRLVGRAVRGEAVVAGHDALVGQDVAGDAAGDEDRIEPLVELQPIDHRLARPLRLEDFAALDDTVDSVDPHPAPHAVCPLAAGGHSPPAVTPATAL